MNKAGPKKGFVVQELYLPRVVVTRTKSDWVVDPESQFEKSANGDGGGGLCALMPRAGSRLAR